jgi:hypothetical protein
MRDAVHRLMLLLLLQLLLQSAFATECDAARNGHGKTSFRSQLLAFCQHSFEMACSTGIHKVTYYFQYDMIYVNVQLTMTACCHVITCARV